MSTFQYHASVTKNRLVSFRTRVGVGRRFSDHEKGSENWAKNWLENTSLVSFKEFLQKQRRSVYLPIYSNPIFKILKACHHSILRFLTGLGPILPIGQGSCHDDE